MAAVTAAPCYLLPAPPRTAPQAPTDRGAAVTVLRADGVTAGPVAENSEGTLQRRHLPAQPPCHRESSGSAPNHEKDRAPQGLMGTPPSRHSAEGQGAITHGRGGARPCVSNRGARCGPGSSCDWCARRNESAAPREGQERFQELLEGKAHLVRMSRGSRSALGCGSGKCSLLLLPPPLKGVGGCPLHIVTHCKSSG